MNKRMFFLIGLVVLLLLVLPAVALAQDAPPVDTGVPDLGTTIDDFAVGLQSFWSSSAVLMGFAVYLVVQLLKFALPSTVVETKALYGGTLAVFTVAYFIAQLADQGAFLGQLVDWGTILSNAFLAIVGMTTVPSITYAVGQKLNNPVLGGQQGTKPLSLKPPGAF